MRKGNGEGSTLPPPTGIEMAADLTHLVERWAAAGAPPGPRAYMMLACGLSVALEHGATPFDLLDVLTRSCEAACKSHEKRQASKIIVPPGFQSAVS